MFAGERGVKDFILRIYNASADFADSSYYTA